MEKKDFFASVIAGLAIGIFAALIARSLASDGSLVSLELYGWRLVAVGAACFGLVCVLLGIGRLIGRKIHAVYEAAKFIVVGGLNTLVDFAVLNLLIVVFDSSSGTEFTIFKGVSFVVAVINSYVWNKFWTFSSSNKTDTNAIIRFITVSVIGFGVNVIVASLIVNYIGPLGGISEQLWANAGAIVATAASMVWNFIGYKFFVFHPQHKHKGELFVKS